jgi:eukaryotic-like serine/threonine-protein kinase
MSDENRCRGCGNVLPGGALNGLCPVCLFREGLADDRLAGETGPFMSGTQELTSALDTLDKSLGGLPHVLLRDSELGSGPGPLVQPGSPEMPAAGSRTGRLQLLGEIARGGMGEESSSDAELTTLAQECLAPELEDRPRLAGDVAARINAYRTGVQERLRRAEIARAEEKARAEEATKRAQVERDRLRLTVALAATVIGLILLGVGGWGYFARQHASRRAATQLVVTQAIDEAILLRAQAKAAADGDLSDWHRALAVANKAQALLDAGEPDAALRVRVGQVLALIGHEQGDAARSAAEQQKDQRFLERLEGIRLERMLPYVDWQRADAAYSSAFKEFGIDPDGLDPAEAGHILSQRSTPMELAFYLDDWTLVRVFTGIGRNNDGPRLRLVAALKAADPDPWRNALRERRDGWEVRAKHLANDDKTLASQSAQSLLLLAKALGGIEAIAEYREFVRLDRHSNINNRSILDLMLDGHRRATRLAGASYAQGRMAQALSEYRDAIRFDPDDADTHNRLGYYLLEFGEVETALREAREAVRAEPENASFLDSLGCAHLSNGSLRRPFPICGRRLA